MQYKEKGKGHEQAETKEFIEGAKKVLYKNIAPNLNKETVKKPIARQCLACLLDRVQAGHTSRGQGWGRIKRCCWCQQQLLSLPSARGTAPCGEIHSCLCCLQPQGRSVEHPPHTCTTHVHITVAIIQGHLVESVQQHPWGARPLSTLARLACPVYP